MANSNTDDTIYLPQVTVQYDIQSVMDDVRQGIVLADDVWISCYVQGAQSVHGKANVSISNEVNRDLVLEGRDGVQMTNVDQYSYEVTCPSLGIHNTTIRTPRMVFGKMKAQEIPKAIQAFDISPNGMLYATGYDNGSVSVSSARSVSSAGPSKTGKPHVSSITSLKFFPSNEVLLASSMDMSVSVISATDLANVPRRFKGHSRSVTDTAIVEQGKNVVSCAKDGTVRLWDVGGGKQIKMMGVESWSPILKMAYGVTPPLPGSQNGASTPALLAGEVDTHGKGLWCALQSGRFTHLDLGTKAATFVSHQSPGSSPPLQAIAYHAGNQLVATGSANGLISVYDSRNLSSTETKPLFRCKRNGAGVEELAFAQKRTGAGDGVDLVVATTDGLPFRMGVDGPLPAVVEEFVGYDCDPVRVVRPLGEVVWTAGDDGIVRCY